MTISKNVPAAPNDLAGLCTIFLDTKMKSGRNTIVNSYRNSINRFFQFFVQVERMEDVTPQRILAWKKTMQHSYSDATVSLTLRQMKTIFKFAVQWRWMPSNPFTEIEIPMSLVEKRFVTRDDYQNLLRCCPNQEWRAILALVRYGALRCPGEVCRLRWDDIYWEKHRFHVMNTNTSMRGRDVPLFPDVKRELEKLRETSHGNVFVINQYRSSNNPNLYVPFARIVQQSGIEMCRRMFCHMRESGIVGIASKFGLFLASAWSGRGSFMRTQERFMRRVLDEDFRLAAEWRED